ncbi:NAD(P)/FAD-dependent oxidoreductase [Nocardioides sp. CFH 31398]|uniref:phytoene desaturase family protein n=1 Tax=Nocardioides sp. CFH 31398 TaxID=2919579 RepID=UPI001F05F70B|nr:NAD(P)/FAD-dependent oxidoreductase [Nocardioides sp. CFH 31398]MCH1865325.1 NAD(P)/FAD-dependent oxidoreductase [Nocardioides sp. CFH 31398]
MTTDGTTLPAPTTGRHRPRPVLSTSTYDAVVVGTSLNGLLAAAELAGNGWAVAVLGEFTGSTEVGLDHLTLPGHVHDAFTLWHLHFLSGPAHAGLADDLRRHGLDYLSTPGPLTATVGDAGTLVAHRDPGATAAAFADPRDAAAYVGLLRGVERLAPGARRGLGAGVGRREMFAVDGVGLRVAAYSGEPEVGRAAALSAAELLADRFRGDEVARLWLPWLPALGLRSDDVLGGLALPATVLALHETGMPAVRGGAARFSSALLGLLLERGVHLLLDRTAERIEVDRGRAVAVISEGRRFEALGTVLAATDAARLHEELLGEGPAPHEPGRGAAAFPDPERLRAERTVQLEAHLALRRPVPWADPDLRASPVVHVERLDQTPIAVGQPSVVDPARAPRGRATAWLRAEVPVTAAAEPAAALRHALDQVDRHAPGLDRTVAAWRVGTRPIRGGDPGLVPGGSDHPATGRYRVVDDWEPGVGSVYATGVKGLYHLGAYRHPTLRLGDEALTGGARRLPVGVRVPTG